MAGKYVEKAERLRSERMRKIDVAENVKAFRDVYVGDKFSRFRSFDHVHSAFREQIEGGEHAYVELALHLYAFLVSWGMVRGSCFMLYKDYAILEGVCEEFCERYGRFLDFNPFGGDAALREDYVRFVPELAGWIKNYFADKKVFYKIDPVNPRPIKGATDTLVGKILLGSLGCAPAFDSYVSKAMRGMKMRCVFTSDGMSDLLEFADCHEDELSSLAEEPFVENGISYPVMKYVDMALWEYGYGK